MRQEDGKVFSSLSSSKKIGREKKDSGGNLERFFFLSFNYRPLVRQISLQEL